MMILGVAFLMMIDGKLYARKEKFINYLQHEITIKDSSIKVYIYRDSLHREHMKRCSFISVEEVYADKNGYLKLKKTPRVN